MSGVVVKVTENKLIVTKEDKKVRITAPYADYHYDATFASDAETLAGTETAKAVSPASLEAAKDVEGGLASKDYADGKITQTITKDVTNKAPSENAVFDALALKADAGDVTASLALKADITSLEIEKKLLMDEIDSLKRSAIENSNAPYLTVSDYGDVTLAKNSVGVGTVGVDGVTVENLVVNGDFSNGTTGWKNNSNNYEFTDVQDNVLSIKINTLTSISQAMIYRNIATAPIIGHKYLLKFAIYTKYTNPIRYVWGGHDKTFTPVANDWSFKSFVITATSTTATTLMFLCDTTTNYAIGDEFKYADIRIYDLTAHGLDSLSVEQLNQLSPEYFNGKKTFGGVGCLVSKDSAEVEVGRMYFSTDPMYSNATLRDILTYSEGKYYHTHNVDSDGVAIAEPYDTEVETNGQFLALSEGTVTYEPWYPDIAVYTDKFTLTKAITAVKELYKYGSPDLITDAVIAGDGLSFTSASLTAGDLVYGVFEFSEPLRPLMTIKSRNDDATVVDTSTGTVYTFRPVVTDGVIASWELTEV